MDIHTKVFYAATGFSARAGRLVRRIDLPLPRKLYGGV